MTTKSPMTKAGNTRSVAPSHVRRARPLPAGRPHSQGIRLYDLPAGIPRGCCVPAGFPDAVAKRIEAALEEAIEDPAVVQKTN
ncbi:hypothetical protein ACFFGR_17050 [Arthrobacter liuii]|uniref:Uncharacterized protein n=1 Tax=Arthrobacter liuii TaxID=1476996 RepID=A0ABQ2AYJ7_9MICC|nr:hypothetical protein GCM10007170_43900 [Arthrobacter liuii]